MRYAQGALPPFGDTFGGQNAGWLYTAGPVGALAISVSSGWAGKDKKHGLAIAGFGLSTSHWVGLFFLAMDGAADGVSGIFRMTI